MMKIQRKTQSGRSMVEILGVLAIIGVLSIGGVAGYRYAMNRHQVNTYLNRFSMIYNAAFFAYHKPNSYMSCCSFDSVTINGDYFSACALNGADWRDEQRAEILSYLGQDWCKQLVNDNYCFLENHLLGSQDQFGWEAVVRNNNGPSLFFSFYLARDLDEDVCADVVRAIANSPVYSENLLGFHYITETAWTRIEPTEENIKSICAAKNGLSFHYALPKVDQWDP